MHKRIYELAVQAKIQMVSEPRLQEFAELIIQECMDIVSNQTTLDTNEDFREGFSHGRKLAWTEIKKHFGVEE